MSLSKDSFKIISIIIGTLIGAGFASGKEIYTFFVQFNIMGFFSIIISCLFICIIIYKTCLLIFKNDFNSYSDFLNYLFGKNIFKKYFYYFINFFYLFHIL